MVQSSAGETRRCTQESRDRFRRHDQVVACAVPRLRCNSRRPGELQLQAVRLLVTVAILSAGCSSPTPQANSSPTTSQTTAPTEAFTPTQLPTTAPTPTPVPPTPTPVPPTDTPVPPTNTPVPPTDTPVPTATAAPPTSTPIPPPTPTSPPAQAKPTAPAGAAVAFTAVQGAKPGGQASATVRAGPNAQCSLSYTTPAGTASTAQGLGSQTANASGTVTWTWTIGPGTKTGTGSLAVNCGGSRATSTIQIG